MEEEREREWMSVEPFPIFLRIATESWRGFAMVTTLCVREKERERRLEGEREEKRGEDKIER